MDCHGRIERRVQEINAPKVVFFKKLVKRKFHDQPQIHDSFLFILYEYTYGRIEFDDMYLQISRLFSAYPVMIRGFRKAMSTKDEDAADDDDADTPSPAKKAKNEDESPKATTVFDPTSIASTSYASDFSQSPCSSGSYTIEMEAVASCSSSSSSRPENAAEGYEAHKKKIAHFIDGTLYVTETKTKLKDWPQAYEHLTELVNEIGANRIDTHTIMVRASDLLQGYPELIESFNIFLPEGYKIVILSDDHEMSSD